MDVLHSSKQIQSICAGLDVVVAEAREALRTIHRHTESGYYEADGDDLGDGEILEHYLTRAFQMTLVGLESLGLWRTRRQLLREFKRFVKRGLATTKFLPDFDSTESKPLDYLHNYIEGIRLLSGTTESSLEQHERRRLETLLRNTAVLVRRRSVQPTKEKHVQDVMNDYLGASFSGYSTGFSIAGGIKNFVPDGGVRDLRTAIEFKFADSERELEVALAGVFEDIAGYAGSNDWTTFYSVVYMTEPFESESAFGGELKRAGASSWQAILVTGAGERKKKQKPTAT